MKIFYCPVCGSPDVESEPCCICVGGNDKKSTYGFRHRCIICQGEFLTGTGIKKEKIIQGNDFPELNYDTLRFNMITENGDESHG